MAKKVLTITEARRNLPSLIKQVAQGGGPVYIGPRGEAVVALVSPAEVGDAVATGSRGGANSVRESRSHLNLWGPLRLEIIGTPEELLADLADIRRRATARLDAWPDRPPEDLTPAAKPGKMPRRRPAPKATKRSARR